MNLRAIGSAHLRDHAATSALIVGVGLLSAVASPANAQQAASASSAAASVTEVGELIVTATRREEALRDVPIAVTAMSGETAKAAHIENFADIPAKVPGAIFIYSKGPSTAAVQIRGQVTQNDAPGLELPVAIFQDDIYYGTLASFSGDFFDVQQIAVLRGPQGTTFGRNVVGGALQITNHKAELGRTYGEIDGTFSSYLRHGSVGGEAQGFVNFAIRENLAGRVAFSTKDVDGYEHNILTGNNLSDVKMFSVRPSIRWDPNDDLSIVSFISYTHENSLGPGYGIFGQGSVVAANRARSKSPFDTYLDVDGRNRRDIFSAQVRADLNRPYGAWTSITSYRTLDGNQEDDGDGTPLPLNKPSINRSKEFQFSQELRFTSPSGRKLEYIAGIYYSFENIFKAITIGFDGRFPQSYQSVLARGQYQLQIVSGDSHTMSIAPYAEFKFHVTDAWALTAGARYTVERKNGYTNHAGFTWAYGGAYNVVLDDKTWSAFTPRVIVQFQPSDEMMFYGGVSTGFKGGGWALTPTTAAAALQPLQPEKSTSYEVGAKILTFDKRLSVNIAAFDAITKDAQVRTFVNGTLRDTNAGRVEVKGVELESAFTILEGLQIGANYAYTDAVYKSFIGCTGIAISDCTGSPLPYTPKNDLLVFGDYDMDLGQNGSLKFHVDAHWSSKYEPAPQRTDPAGLLLSKVQPYLKNLTDRNGVLNAWITYVPASDRWSFQIWGKNLTNRVTAASGANYFFNGLSPAEVASGLNEFDRGIYNPPRQVGMTARYKFD